MLKTAMTGMGDGRLSNRMALVLVLTGPLLVFLTLMALGPMGQVFDSRSLLLVLLADLVYVLIIAALVAMRVARLVAARRSDSAGSRLHLRLSTLFATIALVPTVTVAVFAALTLNVGLEGWFSDRVQRVVGNSLAAAEAYQFEQERDLRTDAGELAAYLETVRRVFPLLEEGELRSLLSEAQAQIQRGLRVAFIVDGEGEIRARGERSFRFNFTPLTPEQIAQAQEEIVIIRDWPNNEFRALVALDNYFDRYLYVAREVDGNILSLLDETRETVVFYQQLERERGRLLFQFGALYLGFALILILGSIWLGLNFAERLARPVGRLAEAAGQVGSGDLDVQVRVARDDDEIALLGRVFNQMTRQLKGQRETLLENNRQIEARRRLFDSVLGSVTAGVIGLDAEGRVEFINRAAVAMLELDETASPAEPLDQVVPEFAPLLDRLRSTSTNLGRVQEELRLSRSGRLETLLVRMAERRRSDAQLEGYVVAFDDVSELVSAQRMAAWGDVARRIAHEIKNPLTPIQLSSERIERKFSRKLDAEDAESLSQLTSVIVRQTNDLRRIVDEFSRFARMPEPDRRPHDLAAILRDCTLLQESGQPDVRFQTKLPDTPVIVEVDETMMAQAFTNLIKNAGEAIETRLENEDTPAFVPEIRVCFEAQDAELRITISDNGIGLPEDRARLFEPYVTTRAAGTGLGLSIVRKIMEEHGGTLRLEDAEIFEGDTHAGAKAVIRLPRLSPQQMTEEDMTKMASSDA
ncbi:sensor histidine kinase NtrY-like [Roseinatronobacter bogoriensis]|uniref:histidine kinase n=1 Tax=Roseinatronobacter bogoriensis subsp. barguzinensis TaxID=441209 RepID=A0A2K8KFA9_9RHOB|nr:MULTISPECIES: PAS domain-containing sensor histidine kinase [Rhodobaca]ATX66653.1 PAS domain-containing sensor histidine kinase [Rhodobaca barguzinensis]MBB4207833.1 two-component system nitrogen regulation sensor histidine kinase NtrY [Rhodobaca bogoriensis DSM 18756]TDW39861.1 two-component system nitrogen regulation sensor histidine kinase NtrY [Rhodobaca barguzinensis]TDY70986.1 two-component system nitrogen regulation sensor histidine kinase NtrY [Rhodobaca bogoriensis DSM 18756]